MMDEDDDPSMIHELPVRMNSSDSPLLSLEEASRKVGPEVLEVLDKRFKGKLTGVRHPDERDHLF